MFLVQIERRPDRILARLAVLLNVFLMLANLLASYISGSLAIVRWIYRFYLFSLNGHSNMLWRMVGNDADTWKSCEISNNKRVIDFSRFFSFFFDGEKQSVKYYFSSLKCSVIANTIFFPEICLFMNKDFTPSKNQFILSVFVDSLMDVLTGVTVSVCLWLINKTDYFKYPRGRTRFAFWMSGVYWNSKFLKIRLEIIGVILCSIIMGIANVVVIFSSIMAIIQNEVC